MKKIILGLFCLAVLFACKQKSEEISSSAMMAVPEEKVKMIVKWVSGKAWQEYKGQQKDLRNGSSVFEGAEVNVEPNSMLDLSLSDGSVLRLMEKTKLVVSKVLIEETRRNVDLKLDKGAMYFKIMKNVSAKENNVRFQTATATAAIRGTEGGIFADESGTKAYLREGKLHLVTADQKDSTEIIGLEMAVQKQGLFVKSKSKDESAADQAFQKQVPAATQWNLDSLTPAGQGFSEAQATQEASPTPSAQKENVPSNPKTEAEYQKVEQHLEKVEAGMKESNSPAMANHNTAVQEQQDKFNAELERKQAAVNQALEVKKAQVQQNIQNHDEGVKAAQNKVEQAKQKSGLGTKSKDAFDELDKEFE